MLHNTECLTQSIGRSQKRGHQLRTSDQTSLIISQIQYKLVHIFNLKPGKDLFHPVVIDCTFIVRTGRKTVVNQITNLLATHRIDRIFQKRRVFHCTGSCNRNSFSFIKSDLIAFSYRICQ